MKIQMGIASTTHVDRQNERLTKEALDDMAKQINGKYIPQLIEHDWDKHVGMLLYGEVFQLDDGEYAVGFVSGQFEYQKEYADFVTGQPNLVWRRYKEYLNIDELKRLNGMRKEKSEGVGIQRWEKTENIAELLERYLDSTDVLPDGRVCKIKRFIASTGDLEIHVYPKDHYPAHFHVLSKQRGIDARFDLGTFELISVKKGDIRESDVKKIQSFLALDPMILEKLRNEYDRLQ